MIKNNLTFFTTNFLMSSDNSRNSKKQAKSSSQHGSRSTEPQMAGSGSSSSSSAAHAGTTPREPSLSGKTREFLNRATAPAPKEPPLVTPLPGGLEPDGDGDVQEDEPVDEENPNPTNQLPNIQRNVPMGVNSDFLKVFSDMARSFNFNASDIASSGRKSQPRLI